MIGSWAAEHNKAKVGDECYVRFMFTTHTGRWRPRIMVVSGPKDGEHVISSDSIRPWLNRTVSSQHLMKARAVDGLTQAAQASRSKHAITGSFDT